MDSADKCLSHRYAVLKKSPRRYAALTERTKAWKSANPEKVLAAGARYREENREKRKAAWREYYAKNKDVILAKHRERSKTDKGREYARNKVSRRHREDIQFRLKSNCKTRIRTALKLGGVRPKTEAATGCSMADLRAHIESLFKPGMTWENYGPKGWHIDHIKPCASFDLTDPTQLQECFNFKNLQPLWWWENISKGSKTSWLN